MKDPIKTVAQIIALAIIIVLILLILSSCKILTGKKTISDSSADVSKTKEGVTKTDSTGIKSDKTSTKETIYYPQPIYIQGKDGEPKVIFVPQSTKETGTEKTESVQLVKDESWREAFDSLMTAITKTKTNTDMRVGPDTFQIIILCALGLVIFRMFGPYLIKILLPIKI